MICENCGAEYPEGKRFCGQCGAALGQAPVRSVPPQAARDSLVVNAPPPIPLISMRGRRRVKIGAIVAAIALVVGSVLGFLYYSQPVRGSCVVSTATIDAGQRVAFGFTPSRGVPPYRYSWAFGDGTMSAEQNPNHTYTAPGTYAPSVTVWDSPGKKMTWATTILVNSIPSIAGTASPASALQSFNASFTAQGQDGTPGYSYHWQFGDGSSSDAQNPSHFYTSGTYTAVVVVEDAAGMTASWSTSITVPPTGVIVTVSPSIGYSSLNASFSAQPNGGTPGYTYLWQFGDGATSTLQNPIHHYTMGNYNATLVVTDSAGRTASWTGSVTVEWPLTTGFTYRLAPSSGFTEDFGCTPDQGLAPYSFYWDFGDGQSSTLQNPTHLYVAGLYTVTLTVSDSAGETVQKQCVLSYA